jgi:hypothetical protein
MAEPLASMANRVLREADPRPLALARVFWIALALAGLASIFAIISARDLVYDGAYYVLGIAAHGDFQLFEPPRRTVEFLQQCIAVGGVRLGIRDLWTLGQLFSLGASGWPVVLTLSCWFALPQKEKSWIVGPLANLVFAIPAANFTGISETIIASCLLWLAFFLVAFRLDRPIGAAAAVGLAAACAFVHESAAIFLLLIAMAAASRLRTTRGFARVAALVVIVLSLGGAIAMLRWILVPRSTIERGDFLVSLFGGFLGTPGAPNMAALASVASALGVIVVLASPRRARIAVGVVLGALACAFLVLLFDSGQTIAPSRLFAARGVPIALSTLFAAAFLWLRYRDLTPARFATAPVLAIVLGLSVFQFLAQDIFTANWNFYAHDLGKLVAGRRGGVPHSDAMATLDPERSRFRRELLESWSVEPLSVLLAPQGHVEAIVLAAPLARWVPYRLDDPATLPRSPSLDWSRFCPKTPCA